MTILEMCMWIQNTNLGTSIRESVYTFPVLEGSHLLGISFSVGFIMVSDLRLMGWWMKNETMSSIMDRILPWSIAGFAFMTVTGVLLFISEAAKCYNSPWFRCKVVALILAGINIVAFHSTIYRRMSAWDHDNPPPAGARWAGFLSLFLWALVIAAGRTTAYNI